MTEPAVILHSLSHLEVVELGLLCQSHRFHTLNISNLRDSSQHNESEFSQIQRPTNMNVYSNIASVLPLTMDTDRHDIWFEDSTLKGTPKEFIAQLISPIGDF